MTYRDALQILLRVPNWLGDAVMCEPAIRALRRTYPEARLTVLGRPSVVDLLDGHPDVAETMVYDHRGRHQGLWGKWQLAQELRGRKFDLAVLFQNAFEAAFITALAGIPRRYGYATDGRGFLLTTAVPKPRPVSHQVSYYLELLRQLGCEADPVAPRLYLKPEEEAAAAARLAGFGVQAGAALIGLNPGSTYGTAKRWLPDRFANAASKVAAICRDLTGRPIHVVIVGAPGEEALGDAIARQIEAPAIVLSGRTSIRELMAITKRCRLYLTNDTGPMHIAAAFGVPVVAVFGPTDWRTTAPFGDGRAVVRTPVECAPCLLRECPIDHRCMTGVTVEQVVEAARQAMTFRVQSPLSPHHSALSTQHSGLGPEPSAPSTQHLAPSTNPLMGVTVFLDRDGTLNRDSGYLNDPEAVELLPGVGEALARLSAAGATLIVVTNQSGVARGLITGQQLTAIHERLGDLLAQQGVVLTGLYVCPHHPEDGCRCRKPETGLIEQACREHGLDRTKLYVVGDRARDVLSGQKVGARTVLLLSGEQSRHDLAQMRAEGRPPDHVADGMAGAADWILRDRLSRRDLALQLEGGGDRSGA
ncbi:MAG TPA: lipopolysaccharide heptosyltransferase II [Nitrospiraceae bacterium]|nr:lipopolysaccharide heptosyltransferase II [Nitrospiraceae bacterium]